MCCILFENYIYKCAGASDLLYSYTNAHGFWLKGFYLPINPQDAPPAGDPGGGRSIVSTPGHASKSLWALSGQPIMTVPIWYASRRHWN